MSADNIEHQSCIRYMRKTDIYRTTTSRENLLGIGELLLSYNII